MPASMNSVTTRGFSLSGGFAGSAPLVVTMGYGSGAAVVFDPASFPFIGEVATTLPTPSPSPPSYFAPEWGIIPSAWKTQAAAGRSAGGQSVTGRPPNP